MEGGIHADAVLDYVVFQISSTGNWYDVHVCSQGKTEELASGPLGQLAFHLPEAKLFLSNQLSDSFKLQIDDRLKSSSWFKKSTLASFLHLVNASEALKVVNSIDNEMSQLEDTRRFHLTLYAKENGGHCGDGAIGMHNYLPKDETASSDATKNDLLRAMDSRLLALKEELVAAFNQAAGAACSAKQISDLAAFAEHFGAKNLRNSLSKLLSVGVEDQPSDPVVQQSTSSCDPRSIYENGTEICETSSHTEIVKPVRNIISPAKIAHAERQSSTESEESSDSNEEDRSFAERSRPLIRSATPKRSASPMRRIQIGRSGSRRSTALTIKSLNYFPARERISSIRDAEGDSNGDEESDQPQKKPENTVRRMSVQDAIHLFESKQNDQNLDIQRRRASELSSSTNKSVLRRWSGGMGEAFTHCSQESASDTSSHNASNTLAPEAEKKSIELKAESDNIEDIPNQVEIAQEGVSLVKDKVTSPIDNPADINTPKVEEINSRAAASAEWNRQKEAELNQMLMKMMESKPGKYQGSNPVSDGYQDISSEQRGGSYGQYKEKRDERLRAENAGKRAAKEAQFKVMQQTLDQSKAEMASKSVVKGKQDPLNKSHRPRRNSSSPVLPKKEVSKPISTKKGSPKTSTLPATRSSWSSGTLSRTTGTSQTKTAAMTSTSTTPNRRKSQPAPSPTRLSPRTEGPLQQSKGKKGIVTDVKPSLRGQESKQQKMLTKSNKTTKTKVPPTSEGGSAMSSAKPSFYSKVTKKSSVVPLETKPFLKKGTGIGPGVGPVVAKTKVSQSDESSKNSENLVQAEETECSTLPAELNTKVQGDDLVQQTNNIDVVDNAKIWTSLQGDDMNLVQTNNSDQSSAVVDNAPENHIEIPVPEIQPDMDLVISSAAWVEAETQRTPTSCENGLSETALSPGLMPVPSSSPRVRHSLSQMLQADSCEPEIIEWGNAENPPALVYQKDSPKGLKRLLKFARKSKGDANVTGWASPSVFSEGEDDQEEPKAASKRTSDALLRKATLQAKGYGKHNNMLSESFDSGNSSKREVNNPGMPRIFSGQSSMTGVIALSSVKSREGRTSDTASTKATRSFFSLSTFRSSKSSETKLR